MKRNLAIMAAMMTIAISATAMPYETAKEEALFLSDKMAYELDLTEPQYEAVYEINLDYLMNVNSQADVLGTSWIIRDRDLRQVLADWQYDLYLNSGWFYRPVVWKANDLTFSIYTRYDRGRLFKHRPAVFISYRGGHNHRNASFYARHHFGKVNLPKIHDRHSRKRHFDEKRPKIVISNRQPAENGSRHTLGLGNRTTMTVTFGNRDHKMSVDAPKRIFGSHHHDKRDKDDFKDHDKDDHHRHFGRGHR